MVKKSNGKYRFCLDFRKIKIHGYPLAALVNSGSNRTLLGREGIKIIRTLKFATTSDRGVQIRTANGQIATIREEIRVPIELVSSLKMCQEITVVLLPSLAVRFRDRFPNEIQYQTRFFERRMVLRQDFA